jgi:penicillin-binding protein 1A
VLARAGGAREVAALAARFGLEGPFPNDATLALGTGEVTLLELAAAYAAFANGGRRVVPHAIAQGRSAPEPVLAPEHAAAMRRMLTAAVARGTGRAAAIPGRAVAGKTGTTQEFRDAWFVGFAGAAGGGFAGSAGGASGGSTVIGVWLGNDDASPMDEVAGGGLPARLFREIAESLPAP